MSITVVLADDHLMVRDSLCRCLGTVDDIQVLAAVSSADEAVAAVLEHRPTVAVLDVDMPGAPVFGAIRKIKTACPATQLLMLSGFWHDHYVEQALSAGAIGYVTKTESLAGIIAAIRSAAAGTPYFSPEAEPRLVRDPPGVRGAGAVPRRGCPLTPRERDVLRCVADGLTNKEIAARLQIAPRTADRHVERVMRRLDIHDRVNLARYAIRAGMARP